MSEAKCDILGIGNPLLDISATVDQAFLDKYGFALNNAILAEEKHLPAYDEMKKMEHVEFIAGGATLNSIQVCQWCLVDRPGSTAYIGCIGNDADGQTMTKCVEARGVAPHFKIDNDVPTGTCAVAIKDKERSLCANLSAANKYDISHLKTEAVTGVYENAKVFYIAGFFLTVSPESILTVGAHAAKENKIFCMNLSAPFIAQFFGEPLAKVMPFIDFLFANETEAETYGKTNNLEDCSVAGVAKHIAALPKENKSRPRVVVFTQGSSQTVVFDGSKVITVEVPKIDSDKIVDSNGAGDAFVGGFLSQLIQGKELQQCVEVGHNAAGYIIQRSGASNLEGKPAFM